MYDPSLKRRTFLRGALAAGTSAAILPSRAFGASPNEKLNLACVGIGNRGEQVVDELAKTGLVNVVAICDTDMGAPHTRKSMGRFPKAKQFQDFRVMFDKMADEIDVVSIATPDFSHFPIAILAMSLGKHIYVEKPLAATFRENQLLMDAEKKYKVAAQMGNQGHSEANYFQFKAWVDAGVLKDVTRITAFMNNPRRWHDFTAEKLLKEGAAPLPDTLDWDTWLATSAERDYNKNYINGQWRCWYDLGMGALGDWGAHIFDTAHEFLELGMPVKVTPTLIEGHSEKIFPQASTLAFAFPERDGKPACEMTWYDGVDNLPPLPENFGSAVVDPSIPPPSSGKIDTKKAPPGKVIYAGEGLVFKGGSHGSTLQIVPNENSEKLVGKLPEVPKSPSNHFKNLLLAAKGEEKCRSNFAVAGPLSQVMNLGVIAQRLNREVKFDPATSKVIGDDTAAALLEGPPPRKGWEEFYKL